MAVDTDQITDDNTVKGRAVIVLHTWKDHLWMIGAKGEPPEPVPLSSKPQEEGQAVNANKSHDTPSADRESIETTSAPTAELDLVEPLQDETSPEQSLSPDGNLFEVMHHEASLIAHS